jgi:hypothetical protein
VAGGEGNKARGDYAAVSGGVNNSASAGTAVVGGGHYNTASGMYATVAGGANNIASGVFAAVTGGNNNVAAGSNSMAGGSVVKTDSAAAATFAFGSSFTTSTPYAAVFYNSGQTTRLGVGVTDPTHNIDVAGGAYCDGANWVNASSRELKTGIANLSAEECRRILTELASSEVVRFKYKAQQDGKEHVGLIAEDAPSELATAARDGINTGDAIGCLLAAVKAQKAISDQQQAEIEILRAELAKLQK